MRKKNYLSRVVSVDIISLSYSAGLPGVGKLFPFGCSGVVVKEPGKVRLDTFGGAIYEMDVTRVDLLDELLQ